MEEKELFSVEEYQLINIEGKIELESHHFATTNVIIGSSVDTKMTPRECISTQLSSMTHR